MLKMYVYYVPNVLVEYAERRLPNDPVIPDFPDGSASG
jgi:hypothetical protein